MLQEVGDRRVYKKFRIELGDTYFFYPEKTPKLINRHGALLFLTQKPLNKYLFRPFRVASGPRFPFNLPEILSKKGFQVCEILIKKQRLIFIHTHLLANFLGKKADYSYTAKQLPELIKFIKQIPLSYRTILAGDMNFTPDTALYKKIINTDLLDPLKNTKKFTHTISNLNIHKIFIRLGLMWADKREDFVFMRGFTKNSISQQILDKKFTHRGRVYDLSDHYGITSSIEL